MTFVFGEYRISKDGFSNLKTLESFIKGQEKGEQVEFFDKENDEVLVNKYVDKIINQSLFGTINSNITDFNQKHNVTKGVFFETFEILTKGQTQLQKLVDSVTDYTLYFLNSFSCIVLNSNCSFFLKNSGISSKFKPM